MHIRPGLRRTRLAALMLAVTTALPVLAIAQSPSARADPETVAHRTLVVTGVRKKAAPPVVAPETPVVGVTTEDNERLLADASLVALRRLLADTGISAALPGKKREE